MRPPMPTNVLNDLKKINGSTDNNNDSTETPTAVTHCNDKPPIFISSIFKDSKKSNSGLTSNRTKEENLDFLMIKNADMKIEEIELKNS